MPDIRSDKSEVIHYDDPDFRVYFRKNVIPKEAIFSTLSIHWHDEIEILYVTKGRVKHRLNDQVVTVSAGEGLFINSRQLHLIMLDGVDVELSCVIFHPMVLTSERSVSRKYVSTIIENDKIPFIKLSEEVGWQKDILKAVESLIKYESHYDGFPMDTLKNGHEFQTIKTIYDIWAVLVDNVDYKQEAGKRGNHELTVMKEMISFVHSSYAGRIELKDICRAGLVGKTKCTQLFERYLNTTPMEYVKNYRVEKSFELLEETDISVTEIAYETGFSDASYFSKLFKTLVGVSPLQYRKKCRALSGMQAKNGDI